MMGRFRKFNFFVLMLAFLIFFVFICRPAWAAAEINKAAFVLQVAAAACGVDLHNNSSQFYQLYKGYLRSKGDTAALNKLEAINNLSWGDTVTGMDSLVHDLNVFFDTYVDYTDDSPTSFSFPCKAEDHSGWITDLREYRISSTPFSDVYSTPPDGYVYLFSNWDCWKVSSGVNAGRIMNVKRNFFVPAGTEIIGYWDQQGGDAATYDGLSSLSFYTWDSAKKDVVTIKLKYAATSYWADTGAVNGKDSAVSGDMSGVTICPREISKVPFKVFCGTVYMKRYFDQSSNEFYACSSLGRCVARLGTGSKNNIHDAPLSFVNDSFVLPADNEVASDICHSFIWDKFPGTSVDVYTDALMELTSFSVGYPFEYTVNYEYDGVQDGSETLTVSSHDRSIRSVPLKDKAGYRLASESYTPALPATVSTEASSITVNYESWEYPYTVEYYYDGVLGGSKELSAASYENTVTSVPAAPRSGYRLAAAPYTPTLPAAIDDTDNVIKVNYESWEYPYTVEYYYDGILGKTKKYTVPSYANTVSEVLEYPKDGYKLANSKPALPIVIDNSSNVIKVNYESWKYPYTVEYYYDGILKETKKYTVPSYANTISEIPGTEKKGYKLADSPYAPALPTVIDESNRVIKVNYNSWEYAYTVKYFFGSTLKETRNFSIPSYDNVLRKVPLINSGVFVLSSSPYVPRLPVVIDDNNSVIEVHYVSPTALAVTDEINGTVVKVEKSVLSIIPALLNIICTVFFTVFLVKWFKRTSKRIPKKR